MNQSRGQPVRMRHRSAGFGRKCVVYCEMHRICAVHFGRWRLAFLLTEKCKSSFSFNHGCLMPGRSHHVMVCSQSRKLIWPKSFTSVIFLFFFLFFLGGGAPEINLAKWARAGPGPLDMKWIGSLWRRGLEAGIPGVDCFLKAFFSRLGMLIYTQYVGVCYDAPLSVWGDQTRV